MIAVLLLAFLLVVGGLGFGVYLLVRPDSPDQAEPATAERGTPADTTSATRTQPPPSTPSATTTVAPSVTGGPVRLDLRTTAGDYVAAVNARDEAAATELTCQRADPGTLYTITSGRGVTLREVELLADTVGTAQVSVGSSETAVLLEKRENGWCVAI